MKKRFTLAGIILISSVFIFNNQLLNAQLKSIAAVNAADTLLRDSELASKVYGFAPFVLTNNVPAKKVIYSSSNPAILFISGDTATIKGAGTVYISAMIEGDSLTLVKKKQLIYSKILTVTTPDVWRVYKTPNPVFVLNYEGFVEGEDESDLISKPIVGCKANMNYPVGVYDLTITGGLSNNYSFTFPNKTKLTIAGVALDDENERISLYPNPAMEIVTITGITKPVTVVICNSLGAIVKTLIVENASFNVGDLPEGLYLVKIVDGNDSLVRKLIKK
jgi:hypothetical protein